MDSEKEFKDILNDKLSQKSFDFDAASWEQAREMIDASREEKKKRPFLWIFLSAAMLIIGGFALYLFNDESSEKNTFASAKENGSLEKENPSVKNSSPEIADTKSELTSNVKSEPESKSITENKTLSKNNETATENVTAKEISSSEKITVAEINKTTKTKAVVSGNKSTSGKNKNSAKKVEVSATVNPSSVIVKTKSDKTSEKITTDNASVSQKTNSRDTKTESPETKNTNPVTKATVDPVSSSSGNNANSSSVNTSSPIAVSTLTVPETPAVSTSTETTASVDLPVRDTVVIETPITVAKVDTASSITQSPVKLPKTYTGIFSVEGGINYFTGWKNPGKRDAKGYNPIVGVNYATKIYKRIGLTVGAQYYSVGQLSYSSHTSKVTRYSLGEESNVTVMTPSKLHYIGFPVMLGYAVSEKHNFGLGCNIGYLMTVGGKQETYFESIKGISEKQVSRTTGYTEGFRPFDTQLLLVYRRKIVKDLYVNTGLIIGLTDIKDNSFFGSNVYERNLGIKFTLTYNLFKK